ncbi:MAG: prolyl oligopeptidase family serine peptidase [Desulfurococcaceae archaeon]
MPKHMEIVRIVESIVYTPTYFLLGVDDNKRIIYQSMEGGFNSIWAFDEKTRMRKRLSKITIHWLGELSRDRRRIPFTRDTSHGKELQIVGFIDLNKDVEVTYEEMTPVRVLGIVDDGGKLFFAGASAEDVALYVAEANGSVQKLLKLDTYVRVTSAFNGIVVGEGHLRRNPRSSEIFVYDYKTNELHVYTPLEGSTNKNPVILNNGKVLFETNSITGDTGDLMVLDLEAGEFTKLRLPWKDYENYKPVEYLFYREFDGKLLLVGKKNGRSKIFVDGKMIETPDGLILNAYLTNDRVYYTFTSFTKPMRIMVYHDSVNSEVIGAKLPSEIEERLGNVEFAKIRSSDDLEVPTYIVKTNKRDTERPFVVYVHGGPWSEVADAWSPFVIVLVAAGYNVVAPNFRGSTGYGEKYRLMDIGDPGGGDLLDVEAVTKWGYEQGLGKGAFIWGYSYGGYMTLWSMFTKPDLFKCGVAGAPVADWEEMYELSDAVFKEFINILFDNKKELLKERSPLHKLHNLKSPLAIIQPQNDTRTPLRPVLNLAYKLMEHGKTFQLHVIPGIGHAITNQDKIAEVLLYMLLFFEKCVEEVS